MNRTRISTTVDSELLSEARRAAPDSADAQLIDTALLALLQQHRGAVIDRAYAATYAEHPIDTPDDWGDLASFNEAAART